MVLVLSIVASVVIWGFLSGLKFALVLVGSIFIHEYGHYYWMGREGIKSRDMFFIPPFGAVARSKEMWPTRGSESRIALAGPAFGLISVLIFFICWSISRSPIFAASVVLASYINLFNLLLPIAILDGGRVIKSILFSINESLGRNFYLFGFVFLGILVLTNTISIIFALLVGYLLWQEYASYLTVEKRLAELGTILASIENLRNNPQYRDTDDLNQQLKGLIPAYWGYSSIDAMKDHKKMLDSLLHLPSMSRREIYQSLILFLTISTVYISAILLMNNHINTNLYSLSSYFK
jgi:Zn-dependent protease